MNNIYQQAGIHSFIPMLEQRGLHLDSQALLGALLSIAAYYRLCLDRWLVVQWQEPRYAVYITYRPGHAEPLTGWLEALRSGPEHRREALEMSKTFDSIVKTAIRDYVERLALAENRR